MRKLIIVLAGLLPIAGISAALISVAGPAAADTSECAAAVYTHNGVTANYCASQELTKLNLELAVTNKPVAYSQLTFKVTSTTNSAQDFEFYHPAAASGNLKLIEYAPRGNPSGLCAAQSNNGVRLVLKVCNAASAGQLFQATGPDPSGLFTWDAANGRAITNPTGAAYARAALDPDTDSAGQAFAFTQ